jgi:tRNA dimethylallyltransferase
MTSNIYIIGGPTASGKSDYALDLANRIDGEIVNGDSMQVYSHLHVLTARPTETQDVPHHLYGVLTGNQIGSLGWWYDEACKVIQEIQARGKIPIVVGGTGLYLRALTQGLSPMPSIRDDIRQEARHLAHTLSEEDFYKLVIKEDPNILGMLHQNDTQRLTRALEVIRTTNQSITELQGQSQKLLDLSYEYIVLLPPREELYERINKRFIHMIEHGAIKEVENLRASNIDPESPILKAVGVPELISYLEGSLSLEEAINLGQQSTRRYAKRQITWFTHQVPEAEVNPAF